MGCEGKRIGGIKMEQGKEPSFEREVFNDRQFKEMVNGFYERRDYRPVGVAVLYDTRNQYLLLETPKCPGSWSFPQGGVELGESMRSNLERELSEETGIDLNKDLENFNWCYFSKTLDAESSRKDKRGFTKGKAYIFTAARYVGDKNLTLQEEEVSNAAWVPQKEINDYLYNGRKEKADLCREALDRLISL